MVSNVRAESVPTTPVIYWMGDMGLGRLMGGQGNRAIIARGEME